MITKEWKEAVVRILGIANFMTIAIITLVALLIPFSYKGDLILPMFLTAITIFAGTLSTIRIIEKYEEMKIEFKGP
jgi:hypothetical protein